MIPPTARTDLAFDLGASYSTVEIRFLVGPDASYCAAAGFTDGGLYCPLRVQGGTACELTRIGVAEDTRQPGPTWTLTRADGTVTFCTGSASGCDHTPDPFQIRAYVSGVYRACIADASSCGWVTIQRP